MALPAGVEGAARRGGRAAPVAQRGRGQGQQYGEEHAGAHYGVHFFRPNYMTFLDAVKVETEKYLLRTQFSKERRKQRSDLLSIDPSGPSLLIGRWGAIFDMNKV